MVVQKTTGSALEELTKPEEKRRAELEVTIKDGLGQFFLVGDALSEIRGRRLHKNTHGSFEAYCREQWGMSKTHANRLIASSEVVEELAKLGPVPSSESAVRPLTKLKPDQRRKVWARVKEMVPNPANITASKLTRLIHELIKPTKKRAAKSSEDLPRLTLAQRHQVLESLDGWLKAKSEQGDTITPKDVMTGLRAVLTSL